MTVWIGVDEAGYGPNLGPLAICASVWSAPGPLKPEDWVERLYPTLRCASQTPHATKPGIIIDDSKKVYQSGKGLEALERSVLALTAICSGPVADVDLFRNWFDSAFSIGAANQRWRSGAAPRQPTTNCQLLSFTEIDAIQAALQSIGVAIRHFAGRLLFPCEFNRQLAISNNKAEVLSETTMELVRGLLTKFDRNGSTGDHAAEDIIILCDKHGGRDRYFALLTHFFPEFQIKILRESEAESAYCWTSSQGKCEIRFCAKAERFPPTAAASMMAKYVRELCMVEWNAFWTEKIPGLAPTAGYPLDAKRYRIAIAAKATELGFKEADYWRRK